MSTQIYSRERRRLRSVGRYLCVGLFFAAGCGEGQGDDGAGPNTVTTPSPELEPPEFGDTFTDHGGPVGTAMLPTPDGPRMVNYELINGQRVFEGDIVLPPDDPPTDGPDYRSGIAWAAPSEGWQEYLLTRRWANGIVPYANFITGDSRVETAIAEWQKRVPLTFVPTNAVTHRLSFVPSSDNVCLTEGVGRQLSGATIRLGAVCNTAAVIHEIGHALGLYHEQSRNDRDTYVSINWACIQPSKFSQFMAYGDSGTEVGPYDFRSIMHYPTSAFLNTSIQGCTWTIKSRNGETIAPRGTPTGGDIAGVQAMYGAWTMIRQPVDYDGDGKVDKAVFRPGNAIWSVMKSSNGVRVNTTYGQPNDVPVPGYYGQTGSERLAIWRPSTGTWHVRNTANVQWGVLGDVPVPCDYDGDGLLNRAVWRPSDGRWYILTNDGGFTDQHWGEDGDIPVPADYDGDSKCDAAVWRPRDGRWHIFSSKTGESSSPQWGIAGDIPVPMNWNGIVDNKIELAVFRPSTGEWWVNGASAVPAWGIPGDVPVPGRWSGGSFSTQRAVFRPSNGQWFVDDGSEAVTYGQMGDVPVP